MLTKLTIRNFKLFDEVEVELGDRVVFIGPNNAGKTSALQALALWNIGLKRWLEKRGGGPAPEKRPGVTINRRDLIAVPVPAANLLWRDMHVRRGTGNPNILIDIRVEGVDDGKVWTCGLEFDYANEESFYCRPIKAAEGTGRQEVPAHLSRMRIAYLQPMSGLAANELRLDEGAINVLLGEGRTAETLRNLCLQVLAREKGDDNWNEIVEEMYALFGTKLDSPQYIKERGEIVMTYRTRNNVQLDISSSGRGQQQTLLLLAHMVVNPGATLLLDEPDAHLEILRQRQIYNLLTKMAGRTGSQILAASHSEVILNEAADRDMVVAFVGRPHRIDDRGSQVLKSLRDIGFEHYYQAEEMGWVLYVEGSTDLAILRSFAERLKHPALEVLERPFVHYVGNQPSKTREHFYAIREAKRDLVGIALYDRLAQEPPEDPTLTQMMWRRREIENYLCQRETLIAFAEDRGRTSQGELFAASWRTTMQEVIAEIEGALAALGRPSPWGPDIKVTDDFLDPVFQRFYERLGLPNLSRKSDYHVLAAHVPAADIDPEIAAKLNAILDTSKRAKPRGDGAK
jgi:ABC-type arginine transport system ATPase subunit